MYYSVPSGILHFSSVITETLEDTGGR